MPFSPDKAILALTTPVSVTAAFTRPSLPALKRVSPLGLKARARVLPLWRWVCHNGVIVLVPGGEPLVVSLVVGARLWVGFLVGEGEDEGGRRCVCTWPEERPRARRGAVGWVARAKRSLGRGRVQIVSYILGRMDPPFFPSEGRTCVGSRI